jgi:hypothetical protein
MIRLDAVATLRHSVLGLPLVAASILFPSCLVTFRDWPDEPDRRAEFGAAPGGTTATLAATSAGGATFATLTAQGGAPMSSYSSGAATSTTGVVPVTGGSSSGGSSSGGSATGGSASGGSSSGGPATGGSATGGSATGGSATGGSATGGASAGGVPSGGTSQTTGGPGEAIKWLTFSGTRASSTDPTNASVGINGEVRVDSDACTRLTFDPSTRCVRGTLCTYGFENQYWGAALVFDFVSAQGLRFRWDPRPVRALGVTYRLRGTQIPKLQLWVLDMDSSRWPDACSGALCEIVGPPYGDESIGSDGTLYFDAMVHDDWDGTGIDYRHRPEDTLSLQFKVPAVITGSVPFDFCLEQLGIIVQEP